MNDDDGFNGFKIIEMFKGDVLFIAYFPFKCEKYIIEDDKIWSLRSFFNVYAKCILLWVRVLERIGLRTCLLVLQGLGYEHVAETERNEFVHLLAIVFNLT